MGICEGSIGQPFFPQPTLTTHLLADAIPLRPLCEGLSRPSDQLWPLRPTEIGTGRKVDLSGPEFTKANASSLKVGDHSLPSIELGKGDDWA
jgi:hypothetical protein